jgi:hypothetical protein
MSWLWLAPLALLTILILSSSGGGQSPEDRAAEALKLDQKLMAEAKSNPESLANLTFLCDEIGPRLTGSANLKRAGEWALEKMKKYGLENVHLEPWSIPEGWERGPARARLLEPDTGVNIHVASYAWTPGTSGKIEGDIVFLKATNSKELEAYKGKLKGAIVLHTAPVKLLPLEEIDKPGGSPVSAYTRERMSGEMARNFLRERSEFLKKEGAAAIFLDAGKPLGLVFTTGGFDGRDRPSASNRLPTLTVAHNHYEMLYRLANRPAPAKTRIELEVENKFVPGPIVVNNVIGEIRGTEKPDELVVLGAHLDSWDLGQGATDNGTGSATVLETARVLAKSGIKPKRTIRFCLFTGEEQGLHGSRAYVEKHKDEMAKVSACLVHDTGTGKVKSIHVGNRPALRALLEKELTSLKELGATDILGTFSGGSDHVPFDRAGVPGFIFGQEVAGYRISHHTQADTLDRAIEPNLIQGAQVMAITAVRIANLDALLPRDRAAARPNPNPNETPKDKDPAKDEKKPDKE